MKSYKDIWKVHVQTSATAKIQLRHFTAKSGQQFLESLPQKLSHQTHLRIKNFLRGLGTRLNEANVSDKDIQSILRHADVSTTQAYYILPNHERAQAGMKKLDKTLRTKYGIKG